MLVSFINGEQIIKFQSSLSVNETINHNNKLLRHPHKDTFVHNKQNIAFTSHLPKKELLQFCDEAIEELNKLTTTEQISELAQKIRLNRNTLFSSIKENFENKSPKDREDIHNFLHECGNKSSKLNFIEMHSYYKGRIGQKYNITEQSPDSEYFPFFKQEVEKIIESIKKSVNTRELLEKMETNPNKPVQMSEIMTLLKELSYKDSEGYVVKNEHLLKGKTTKSPKKLYDNVLSQLWLNAKKYKGDEPFVVAIEKDDNNKLYMTFLNPDTTPLPNSEIDEIIKGNMYRATVTKDKIDGTGLGYKNIIAELKENGLEKDILTLIEKDRERGFKVRVPLFGVE